MQILQTDIRSLFQMAATATLCYLHNKPRTLTSNFSPLGSSLKMVQRSLSCSLTPSVSSKKVVESSSVASEAEKERKMADKPLICTADELHYVNVPNTKWKLALWRYTPCPKAPLKNHPLLLLSGVGTNAIGFDLSPESSFARHMSSQGFDTWILEVRGAGLSTRGEEANDIVQSMNDSVVSEMVDSSSIDDTREYPSGSDVTDSSALGAVLEKVETSAVDQSMKEVGTIWAESQLVTNLTGIFMRFSNRLSGFINEGQLNAISIELLDQMSKLLDDSKLQNSAAANQVRDLSERLATVFEDSQRSVSPLFDLQERFSTTIDNFKKQIFNQYDWDFDHYLEEDIPAAMKYIRDQSKPKDGKLLAIGHSMGGILLYGMLSRYGFERKDSGLAAVVTLASSIDYTSSKSSLKLLVPLADPAQLLNVPFVPLGALLAATRPLTADPPNFLAYLKQQITATDMMHPELLEKLILNNFCTIPAKLLIQLTTAFRDGGLCDRSGTFNYKDHLQKCDVPVLAVAGDYDLICPPEAVYETVKVIPEHLVTYKVFGEEDGPHYAHYDLVGGRLAVDQVFPCIVEFLTCHDTI